MIGFYRGFSLIELMIVVAVVAILSAIAYPSYQHYLLVSHRVEAKNMLLDAANRQETYFMDFNRYTSSAVALNIPENSASGFYHLVMEAADNTYTLFATQMGHKAPTAIASSSPSIRMASEKPTGSTIAPTPLAGTSR
ncbi:type IV pilin protein [Aeromonas caviae]